MDLHKLLEQAQHELVMADLTAKDFVMSGMHRFNEHVLQGIPEDKRPTNEEWNGALKDYLERDMWKTIHKNSTPPKPKGLK